MRIEFGCGYGLFTVPAARRMALQVTMLDIEPEMADCVMVITFDLPNIQFMRTGFCCSRNGRRLREKRKWLERSMLIFAVGADWNLSDLPYAVESR